MIAVRNLPIKSKLTLLTTLTSFMALFMASVAFVVFQALDFRQALVQKLTIMAEMTGYNVSSALSFEYPEAAEETLKSLGVDRHITSAAIYNSTGELFASYHKVDDWEPFSDPKLAHNTYRFRNGKIELFQDIPFNGEIIGTVYLQHDLSELFATFKRYILIAALITLVAFSTSFLFSRRLQKYISRPITHLAEIAADVAKDKDYSLRATKETSDEMGDLIEAFNEMLNEIQRRDAALEAGRNELERRVDARTEELANSLSLLNATLDSTADGILAIKHSGEVTCYNAKFTAMWHTPPEVMAEPTGKELLAYTTSVVINPERFAARIQELHEGPSSKSFDVLELKDGRTFERYVEPQMVNGHHVGLVINFRDITDRRKAESELSHIHQQLLIASRKAGMAEVATSVLHNVGNVLTSVSVSAELVAEKIRQLRVRQLKDLAALLREHQDNLADFLANDPRGRELPPYLLKLSEHLAEPQQTVLQELALLGKNIEHIKKIVSMQQDHASGSNVFETLLLNDLVEDGIRINNAAITRHCIRILTELSDIPPISTDRHQVLQILVNLIGNAKDAVSQGSFDYPQILIRTMGDEHLQKVEVIDNGIGIGPDIITQIFQHGFTTKRKGHGFGLHTSALAAKELGGRVTAYSDGLGKGAVFTLELPVNPKADL